MSPARFIVVTAIFAAAVILARVGVGQAFLLWAGWGISGFLIEQGTEQQYKGRR